MVNLTQGNLTPKKNQPIACATLCLPLILTQDFGYSLNSVTAYSIKLIDKHTVGFIYATAIRIVITIMYTISQETQWSPRLSLKEPLKVLRSPYEST